MKAQLALAIMLFAGAACGDDAPQVPFKLSQQKPAPQGGASASPQAPSADGTSYPKGTQRIELSGHALTLKTHAFRAALELDIDQQGKSDALMLLQDEHGVPHLGVAYGDAEGLGSVEIKRKLFAGPVCEVPSASLARLGPKLVLVRMMVACTPMRVPGAQSTQAAAKAPAQAPAKAPGQAPAPTQEEREDPPVADLVPMPDDLPPGEPTGHDWLIPIDEALEAVAELRLRSNALSASWSALDIDGDDHSDLNLALKVGAEGVEPLSVVVSLLDRPSGFAIDAKDIEATLIKIADEAKQARKSQPDRANALAERVLFAHRSLCAEAGAPLIELSPDRGLPCGPSLAAGRALTIHIAGLARRGRLLEAVRRYGEVLDASKYTLTANDRERADYALRERTILTSWRGGPSAIGVSGLAVRRSAIEIVDETRLIVRDAQGVNAYDMGSGALEPAPTAGADVALRDPSGKLAVADLYTSCLGIHASIVNASQLVAGVMSGEAIATPVLLPADPRDGCAASYAPKDPRELSVLGWTSAGLVLARDAELLVIKLDANHVAQPAQPLASITGDKAALFAALGSSAISSSGRFQLLKTALGLLRVDHEQGGMLLLSWPSGVVPERVSDVAISPSGGRVALLADGRVFFADASASAAPAPSTAAPAAPAPNTPAPTTPAPTTPAPTPTTPPRAAPPAPPEP